jgi:nucleoside transporter
MAAPIIGMIADRHFASQKVLAILNILTAVFLFLAAMQTTPVRLFAFLLIAMLCYMPTWGLTSAIAMANSPAEKFPQIRVFGSIGWVAAALFSIIALSFFNIKIELTRIPMLCGAAIAVVAAIVNITLPNTPPPAKGQKASVIDALGLRSISLMKDRNFAVFIILSTLMMIPFMIWFNFGSQFLKYEGFKYLTATMNIGQFAEMFFMLLIPLALAKMGIKWAMLSGLVALVIRYAALMCGGMYDQTWLYFVAILVHGIIFGFFFVGGQIYVDKKADSKIRSQAQGLLFLITFGIGSLLANFFNSFLINYYTNDNNETNWDSIWKVTTIISAVLLGAFLVLFRDKLDKPGSEAVSEAVKEISEEEIV